MSDLDFYQTRAGRVFYDQTVPELVEQVRRLADAVERLVDRIDSKPPREDPPCRI